MPLAKGELPYHTVDELMGTIVACESLLHHVVQAVQESVLLDDLRERIVSIEHQAALGPHIETDLRAVIPALAVVPHQLIQSAGELRKWPGQLIAGSRGVGVVGGA